MSAGSLRETVADGPPIVATAPLDQLSARCLRYGPSLPSARILQRRHGMSRCGNKKAPTVSEANSGTDKLLSFRSRPRFPFARAVRAASQHSALGGPLNASQCLNQRGSANGENHSEAGNKAANERCGAIPALPRRRAQAWHERESRRFCAEVFPRSRAAKADVQATSLRLKLCVPRNRPSRASRFCIERYCFSRGASTNRLPYFPQHKS